MSTIHLRMLPNPNILRILNLSLSTREVEDRLVDVVLAMAN